MGSSVILPAPGQPVTGPDPNFKTGSVPNLTTFNITGITPPSPVYVQRDDQLFIQAASTTGSEVVTFAFRIIEAYRADVVGGQPDAPLHTDGGPTPATTIQPYVNPLSVVGTYTPQSQTLPVAEGFLLSASAIAAAATTRGQCFARAFLLRTGTTTGNFAVPLFADYVTQKQGAGWPGGRVISPLEGPGFIRTFPVTNPAAGADWNFLVPAGARHRIQFTNAQLVTSATVATRVPELQGVQAGVVIETSTPNQTVPASTTAQVSGSGSVATTVTGVVDVCIPLGQPFILTGSELLQSKTLNIQAGDQWSAIRVTVEEWLDF